MGKYICECGNSACIEGACVTALQRALDETPDEEILEIWDTIKGPDIPKNQWISIQSHLPGWLLNDLTKGYTEYKVKNELGQIGISKVTDHNVWKHHAVDCGITHWWNGDFEAVWFSSCFFL